MLNTSFRDYVNKHSLDEALVKGIPAWAIQHAYDLPKLIKDFAKETKHILGKEIDMKKCMFGDVKESEVQKALANPRSIKTVRIFFSESDSGDDEITAFAIIKNGRVTYGISGPGFSSNRYDEDDDDDYREQIFLMGEYFQEIFIPQ